MKNKQIWIDLNFGEKKRTISYTCYLSITLGSVKRMGYITKEKKYRINENHKENVKIINMYAFIQINCILYHLDQKVKMYNFVHNLFDL